MMMDDKQFEAFLHEFEPRAPGVLPSLGQDTGAWTRRLLAAAVVVLAASTSLWLATRQANQSQKPQFEPHPLAFSATAADVPRLSLLQLTRLAQNSPHELDIELDELAQRALPKFHGKDSTLVSLAKE
jgi:hypothetical protein